MSDGKVVWEVTIDDHNVIRDIKDITETIKKESKNWDSESKKNLDNIEKNTKATATSMQSAMEGFTIALGEAFIKLTVTILTELAKWVAASIDVASDLEDVQKIVDSTFGENGAAKVDAWADKAGQRFGYTELQAKKYATTLGVMLKTAGITGEELSDMSLSLTGLASDMASFYGMEPDKAFEKLKNALSGNASALKELGIQMTNADMDKFIKDLGVEGEFKNLDQAEQYLYRYQYIMQKLADTQGDYARKQASGDNLKNLQDQNQLLIARKQEDVGKAVLPLVKEWERSVNSVLKLITGENGTVVTGTQEQLTGWLANAETAAADAKKELDSLGDKYAALVDMDREAFEPGIFDNYGEFILETMRTRSTWAKGKEKEQLEAAIKEMDATRKKITEAEGQVTDYQAQLNQLATETPDTATAGSDIVGGLVDGMASKEGALQAEVERINGILSGIGNGGMTSGSGDIPIDGSFETGLNWVPFDGFLAQLHEGEGILTAEENKIWQRFKSRSSGLDYDTIGGVMRDNVKPGGNVYLDGKRVGSVISDQQGRAYKSLQRSGWQA